jgi:hypothetical protein
MIHGYARVSTGSQSADAQVQQLRAAGAEKLWRETMTGARFDRAQLHRLLAVIEEAVVAHRDALTEYTRERVPLEMAHLKEERARGFADQGIALMHLAERNKDAAMAETAIGQIEIAVKTSGQGSSRILFAFSLVKAQKVRDALKGPRAE